MLSGIFSQISAVSKGVCAYEDAALLSSRGVARNFPGYAQFSKSTHTSTRLVLSRHLFILAI